ncbi:hypothetical protein DEU56DRAFT_795071, partial [Suillus clintonianus]|uniref:uncharacterized protein n=1 Tax=Suillus clintonianus TaxID=1904413 RepID=UPI001B86CBD4
VLRYFPGEFIVEARGGFPGKEPFDMLPRELASINQPEERAIEYLHHMQFFTIWDSVGRVVECQSLEVSIMNRETRVA